MGIDILESYMPPFKAKRVFVSEEFSPNFNNILPLNSIELRDVIFSEDNGVFFISGSREMLFSVSFNRIYITDDEKNVSVVFKSKLSETKNIIVAIKFKLCSTHVIGEWTPCYN